MAEAASPDDHSSSFLMRHQFLIYRLQSLTGLVPIGAYLVIHLLTNASVLNGAETFQRQVNIIHSLGIVLPLIEWVFIFIPILFHAIIGVVIVQAGIPNPRRYPFGRNIRYTLQRVTGIVAFAFILWHVLHMHWMGAPFGGGQFDPHYATSTAAGALQASWWVLALYAVGVLASVFHLANGIWTAGITWGLWTTPAAYRRADYFCLVVGVVLAAVGLTALYGMAAVDVTEARIFEELQEEQREELREEIREREQSLEAAALPADSAAARLPAGTHPAPSPATALPE